MDVFLTSPWIPAEWIKAHGLEPRGVWFDRMFCRGALPLSAGVCAFAEAAVRFAEEQSNSAVIFATTCDQLRRGFDSVSSRSSNFLFNIPATWQTPAARQIYRGEIERLGLFLQELGGRTPSQESLRQEMKQRSEARARLLEAAPGCASRPFAEAVARFHWDGSVQLPPLQTGTPVDSVPLALVGGPLPASHWILLEIIEAAGGRIVLNATENGERSLIPLFDPTAAIAHPLDVLVSGYLENMAGVFQRPNTPLYSWLRQRLIPRQARGIVLWHFTGCDLWRAEAQTLREAFGMPVLLLEADEAQTCPPRDLNRIQAFVETLR